MSDGPLVSEKLGIMSEVKENSGTTRSGGVAVAELVSEREELEKATTVGGGRRLWKTNSREGPMRWGN